VGVTAGGWAWGMNVAAEAEGTARPAEAPWKWTVMRLRSSGRTGA
jgi:hypothetical protein